MTRRAQSSDAKRVTHRSWPAAVWSNAVHRIQLDMYSTCRCVQLSMLTAIATPELWKSVCRGDLSQHGTGKTAAMFNIFFDMWRRDLDGQLPHLTYDSLLKKFVVRSHILAI